MGRVVKPHGIRGEVVVLAFSDVPGRFDPGSQLLVGLNAADTVALKVAESRSDRGKLLVRFEGTNDRTASETLRESLVFVPMSAVELPQDDSFLEHQLAGKRVIDRSGRLVGTLTRVVERKEQDLWEVETSRGKVLIPAAKDIVVEVALEAGHIVIDPPTGLLDDDAV